MSYERGIQAIRLQMPDRIPHTEYISHREFVKKLTGFDPLDPEQADMADREMVRRLDFDLVWISCEPPVQGRMTNMGHAHWYDSEWKPDHIQCPFNDEEDAFRFDAVEEYGVMEHGELVKWLQAAHNDHKRRYPTAVCPGGHYNTIVSACIRTFGWDMFLRTAALDYERFDRVLESMFQFSMAHFRAWAETDIETFICHDDMVWTQGAIFHPNWYRRYVFPRYARLWAPLREKGIKLLFCSDGNFTEFVDDLAQAGADGFIFEPLTDLAVIAERYGKTKAIVGNVDCRILTFGTRDQIVAEVKRCADIGRDLPGYFFAIGNHIPRNIPIENVELYFELIDELGRRG